MLNLPLLLIQLCGFERPWRGWYEITSHGWIDSYGLGCDSWVYEEELTT